MAKTAAIRAEERQLAELRAPSGSPLPGAGERIHVLWRTADLSLTVRTSPSRASLWWEAFGEPSSYEVAGINIRMAETAKLIPTDAIRVMDGLITTIASETGMSWNIAQHIAAAITINQLIKARAGKTNPFSQAEWEGRRVLWKTHDLSLSIHAQQGHANLRWETVKNPDGFEVEGIDTQQ